MVLLAQSAILGVVRPGKLHFIEDTIENLPLEFVVVSTHDLFKEIFVKTDMLNANLNASLLKFDLNSIS